MIGYFCVQCVDVWVGGNVVFVVLGYQLFMQQCDCDYVLYVVVVVGWVVQWFLFVDDVDVGFLGVDGDVCDVFDLLFCCM